jgi:ribosome-associated protein
MSRPDELPPPATTDAPSKTRRKHAMLALQDLGCALVELAPGRLAELDLPERLVDAIAAARHIRAHEARRRQLQYIGKLMREIDPAPLQAALDRWSAGAPAEHARFAAAEKWRDRLLVDDSAIEEFAAAHPGADRDALAALVSDARVERARGTPPHRYRELFRTVRALLDQITE